MQHSKKRNEIDVRLAIVMQSCIGPTLDDYDSDFGVVGRT